ncbi:MAG: CDP-alcohol phosphatidyltransferase family protein [Elusimicrobiaceae bacterium]|nr:CDP-alcohol phosphatidyltransferase family protein [Elusimicrobiaceae bacterium]MBP5617113.1 CDP-alcohol phosphatidyltransferase family protein [Elusimicrobiaceae bacterium]
MTYYSYQQIIDSLPQKKNSRSSLWVRWFIRKLSFPFTYLFINAGWSANQVSLLSWAVIFLAAVCLCIPNFWWMLAGVLLTNFWLVLDCVDGNIARCVKQKTFMGDFFDAIAGYGPFAFTTLALGVAAYHTSFLIPVSYRPWLMIVGAVGAVANIYTRLIHQKYLNCFFAAKNILHETQDITLKDTEDKKSFAYIREQIDKNIGVSGLFMPWLFVALFTSTFDVMLFAYTGYYLLSFAAIIVLYCRKAVTFEQQAQAKLTQERKNA